MRGGSGVECQVSEKTNARSVTTGASHVCTNVEDCCYRHRARCRDGVRRGPRQLQGLRPRHVLRSRPRGERRSPAADTTPRATVTLNTSTLVYTYTVTTPPAGAIDSIALYQVPQAEVLPASATVILCAGAVACAAASGIARPVGNTTRSSLQTSMRAYGTQLVVFTTTAQIASGGAMRGTMYPSP